jgi:hypothetical protein
MAITEIFRWKGTPEVAARLLKEAAPIYKKHGAVAIRMSICRYGVHTGQIFTVATYHDWATFGRTQQGLSEDADIERVRAEVFKNLELQERSVMVTEEF